MEDFDDYKTRSYLFSAFLADVQEKCLMSIVFEELCDTYGRKCLECNNRYYVKVRGVEICSIFDTSANLMLKLYNIKRRTCKYISENDIIKNGVMRYLENGW